MDITFEKQFSLSGLIKMEKVSDFEEGDRLFYELGRYRTDRQYFKPVYNSILKIYEEQLWEAKTWVRSGKFKEIEDPEDFIKNDDRLQDPEYIKHHNFLIHKSNEMAKYEWVNLKIKTGIFQLKKIKESLQAVSEVYFKSDGKYFVKNDVVAFRHKNTMELSKYFLVQESKKGWIKVNPVNEHWTIEKDIHKYELVFLFNTFS